MEMSPFKFLDSYTKEDKNIFFGRDKEIEELYQKVFESKILLVYGISGTGKTSLINCGLANKFAESDWLPITVRRGQDINESLIKEIQKNEIPAFAGMTEKEGKEKRDAENTHSSSKLIPADAKQRAGIQVRKAIQNLYLDHFKPIYLIFDQFEEVFIFGSKEERKELIQTVKEVLSSDIQCKFLFVLREEYLANITEFEWEIPEFFTNRMRIEKMTRSNARQAIEGPCDVHKIEVEEDFSDKLLEKLSPESAEVELTYLQVFLDKVYRLSQHTLSSRKEQSGYPGSHKTGEHKADRVDDKEGDSSAAVGMTPRENVIPSIPEGSQLTFSLNLLDQLGDVSDLLGSFLDEQIKELEDPDHGLAILKSFVSIKGTKKQIAEDEVQEYAITLGQNIEKEELKKLLNKFVGLRILRDKDENDRYELRHDTLAAKIFEKITLVEKELMEVRQFIENAYQIYLKRGILLEKDDLHYITSYESNLYLKGDLFIFLNKCNEYQQSKTKTIKRITVISILVFILFIAIMLKSYFERFQKIFIHRDIIGMTNTIYDEKLQFQYLTDEYINFEKPTAFMYQSMFEAFSNFYTYDDTLTGYNVMYKQLDSEINHANYSNNGEYIVAVTNENQLYVWNIKGAEILSLNEFNTGLIHAKLSPANNFVATLENDGTVGIWDIKGVKQFVFKSAYNKRNNEDFMHFSPDEKSIVGVNADHETILYNTKGKILQILTNNKPAFSAAVTTDGRFVASALSDGTVNLWYFNNVSGDFNLYDVFQCHKDTIWSIAFAKNNKYFLTASADSSAKIFDFNGEKVFDVDDYFAFSNDWYGKRYSKIAHAEFSPSEKAIVLTRYGIQNYEVNEYYEDLSVYKLNNIISDSSNYKTANLFGRLSWRDGIFYTSVIGNRFTEINFSADNQFVSYVINNDDITRLLYINQKFRISDFKGGNPVFSPDTKYLMTISENKIYQYPVDLKIMLDWFNENMKSTIVN